MSLLERVATLIRANLNDLVDRAEDPEKMIKQIILDMHNQFIQVKTQVAIALADLHLLEKKKQEYEVGNLEWTRKAELAVEKQRDDLARGALERAMSLSQLAKSFDEQIGDQRTQVDLLKNALRDLDRKIAEAQAKSDLLIAQHRRSRAVSRAADANFKAASRSKTGTFDRLKTTIQREEAIGQAKAELSSQDIEEKFASLEKEEEIERLLREIKAKARKGLTA
jgi:phage shock protein A